MFLDLTKVCIVMLAPKRRIIDGTVAIACNIRVAIIVCNFHNTTFGGFERVIARRVAMATAAHAIDISRGIPGPIEGVAGRVGHVARDNMRATLIARTRAF